MCIRVDSDKYGFTEGRPGWRSALLGGSQQTYSVACRKRILNNMGMGGSRVLAKEASVQEFLAQSIEEHAKKKTTAEAARSRMRGGAMTEVSGDGQFIAFARRDSVAGVLISEIGAGAAAGSSTDAMTIAFGGASGVASESGWRWYCDAGRGHSTYQHGARVGRPLRFHPNGSI